MDRNEVGVQNLAVQKRSARMREHAVTHPESMGAMARNMGLQTSGRFAIAQGPAFHHSSGWLAAAEPGFPRGKWRSESNGGDLPAASVTIQAVLSGSGEGCDEWRAHNTDPRKD